MRLEAEQAELARSGYAQRVKGRRRLERVLTRA